MKFVTLTHKDLDREVTVPASTARALKRHGGWREKPAEVSEPAPATGGVITEPAKTPPPPPAVTPKKEA